MTLPSVWPLPPEHRNCSLAPARTHVFFSFSGNAVWHYKELYSRATEQPVKDIHGETRRLWCHLQLLVAFQSLRSVRYDLTLFRNMTLVRMSIQVTCNTQFPIIKFFFCSIEEWESCLSFSRKRHLEPASKGLLKHDHFSSRQSSVWPVPPSRHYNRASVTGPQSEGAVQLLATWWPFQPRDPTPTPLSPLSSSLPTKWMTAFRNTRVRHDSEVHMLCHLCSTCFDASAGREAEKDHAYNSTSSQLMLQAGTVSKLQG